MLNPYNPSSSSGLNINLISSNTVSTNTAEQGTEATSCENTFVDTRKAVRLIDKWFAIARRDTTTTDERLKLYSNTEKVATFLDQVRGNTALTVKQKVDFILEHLMKAMNRHQIGEATQLANWVARHTYFKPCTSEIEGGAYLPLHHLFSSVMASTGLNSDSPDMLTFAFVDSASLEYENQKKNLPLEMGETSHILLSNFSSKELGRLRPTSKPNKEGANLELIHRLNRNELQLEDLGLLEIDQVIQFFGDNCSLIYSLKFNNYFKPTLSSWSNWNKSAQALNQYKEHTEELAKKISTHFPELDYLEIDFSAEYPELSKNLPVEKRYTIQLNNLKLNKLTTLKLHSRNINIDLSFVQYLPKLECLESRELLETGSVFNFSTLQQCSELHTLLCSITEKSPTDISCLNECTKLTSLTLHNFDQVKDWGILQKLTALTHIGLRKANIQELSLLDHSSLKSLYLAGCHIKNIILNCSKLRTLDLTNCQEITTLNFLEGCPNLLDLDLTSCNNIQDFRGLSFCRNIEYLNFRKLPQEKINNLPILLSIQILILGHDHNIIQNLLFLDKFPRLKELRLFWVKVDQSILQYLPPKLEKIFININCCSEDVRQALRQKGIELL